MGLLGLVLLHIDPDFGVGLLASFMLPWIVLAGWPIVATILKGNGPRIDFGLYVKREHIRLGVVGGVSGMLIGVLVGLISVKLLGPISATASDLGAQQQGWVLVAFVLCAVIGAPIVEEIAFRGMLFSSLCKSGVKPFISVIVSALIFSLFHFEPERIAILFAIGMVFGELRRRSGSLVPSIVAHIVNNAPAIGLLFGSTGQMTFFLWH